MLGASIKVLMPLVDDKPSMFLGKLLRSGKLAGFQSERLTKLDSFLDIEHRFASTITDMDMNGAMIVAVKKETIAVLLEDCRHGLIVARQGIRRRFLFVDLVEVERAPNRCRLDAVRCSALVVECLITAGSTLNQALEIFGNHDGERLPVVSNHRNKQLVGSISKTDLILALADINRSAPART